MEQHVIPIENTGLFPRLVRDYLSENDDMTAFYDQPPSSLGLRSRLAQVKAEAKDNSLLTEVLREQHGDKISASQKRNLDALQADAAYTVCTGHQLCLFGGPAYMVYKVVSIIKLSQTLSEDSKERIVPLFWLASEDHDIQEIDHSFFYGKRIELETDHLGPAGCASLDRIDDSLVQLEAVLGGSDRVTEVMKMMREAYHRDGDLSRGLRFLLNELFSEYGLLILDAADARLKASFSTLMMREMDENIVQGSMAETLEMLANRGESIQAHARDINLFYMTAHSRDRIVKNGDRFEVLDKEVSWDRVQLEDELRQHPERFSPNVLLRPVYQEFLLPNLAYIGGPGELSYWLQLKNVFHAFDMKMPVALLRDSYLMLDKRLEDKMDLLGFGLDDMFRDLDALHKEYARANAGESPDLKENKEVLIKHFDEMIERSERIDPSIVQFAKAERQKLINAVDNMEKKLLRAEKKKHSDALDRISRLKERVLPGGGLEERKENFLRWYVPLGEYYFKGLFEASDPLTPGLKVLRF